jgi:hypothetical protein
VPHHNTSTIFEIKISITMAIPVNKNGADSRIKGNLSPKLKQQLEAVGSMARSPDVYGASIGKRVVVTEASIVPKAEEASRTEARVVCEVTVEEGYGSCRLRKQSLTAMP